MDLPVWPLRSWSHKCTQNEIQSLIIDNCSNGCTSCKSTYTLFRHLLSLNYVLLFNALYHTIYIKCLLGLTYTKEAHHCCWKSSEWIRRVSDKVSVTQQFHFVSTPEYFIPHTGTLADKTVIIICITDR